MVRLGLVERTVDPTAARARLVGLTDVGSSALHAVRERRRVAWRQSLESWDRRLNPAADCGYLVCWACGRVRH